MWDIVKETTQVAELEGFLLAFPDGAHIQEARLLVEQLNVPPVLTPNGELLWDRTYGGRKDDVAFTVAAMDDGGFAIAGYTESDGGGKKDFWVLRVDKLGEIDWEATFGGRGDDWANSVVALASGGIAAAGWTASDGAGERDFWVLKLDGGGNIVWDHVYGGRKGDSGQSITALADGGLAVAGYTESKGAGGRDFWVLRLDSAGSLIWDKTFGGVDDDLANSIVALGNGDLAVVGETFSKGNDGAWSVAALADGGLAVAGYTESKGAG